MNILLATQNKHKIEEITSLLSSFSHPITIITPDQTLNIEEGKDSYIVNALLKAKTFSQFYPEHYILADDSGLEVLALNRQPGVISAEYAGKNATQQEHINKLMSALENTTNRDALFVSYIILLSPQQEIFISRGECQGRIALSQSGTEGFGYDPIFLPLEYQYQKTLAELSMEQKNKLSHRGKALMGLKDYLQYLEVNHG